MAEIKWIKLSVDIFENRKIKIIEKMPEGYAILAVWLKVLCLAGTVNDGGLIYLTPTIPYTEQMLATQLNMPLRTVQLALTTFKNFEMTDTINGFLRIKNWEKYQNVDGMEKVREQTRNRVAKYRDKQKALPAKSGNKT